MLKIENAKSMSLFHLPPKELFYRENDGNIYYSFFDNNGILKAVNLTTGEEAKRLSPNEAITRIQGTLTIHG